ncbi:unnamed protein product [Angiostrongylus costaricensis]|uniref:BET1 homolog n=1 Tax=Angiostrongylus costaricensis TaxID=334426 RepID=A0A0R3PDB3_ANGCS|nr:unnamed protein product [Angiostrongylus costaricensis]
MAYRGPSTSTGYESSYLERHNDNLVEELSTKVAALKKVTISIGEDVREQNRLLNSMDDDFDSSKGLLLSTMKRLGIVSRAGGEFSHPVHSFMIELDRKEPIVLFGPIRPIRLLRHILLSKVDLSRSCI